MDPTIPNLNWYKAQSREENGPPRCPFASSEQCPKYADSIKMLIEYEVMTPLPGQTVSSTDQKSSSKQQAIEECVHIAFFGERERRRGYHNFCPEVTGDRFGFFASYLRDYFDDDGQADRRKYLIKRSIDEDHPYYRWSDFRAQHYTDCSEYSILFNQRSLQEHNTVAKDSFVSYNQTPKYDLRGATFTGGFAETVQGDQIGKSDFILYIKDTGIWVSKYLKPILWNLIGVILGLILSSFLGGFQAKVQVTSVDLIAPATISLEGLHKNVDKNKTIWVYVYANNSRYYVYEAIKNDSQGTWRTKTTFDIGDKHNLGGTYTVGLLLAETGSCLSRAKEGLSELPACVIHTSNKITIKRTQPSPSGVN